MNEFPHLVVPDNKVIITIVAGKSQYSKVESPCAYKGEKFEGELVCLGGRREEFNAWRW